MKYKAVYDVLNERRQTTPGFCYHDRSGWRAYPQTYMTMQCPLWIIAEDAATGRRLWITQEGTRFSIVSVGSSRPRFVGSNEPLFVGKPEANR